MRHSQRDRSPTAVELPARGDAGAATRERAARRSEAHRRRLRLLDLPAQRHRHVLGVVRGLRGAVGRDRRRTERTRAVRSAQRRDRDRVPAALELHLRPRRHRRAERRNGLHVLWRMAATFVLGAAFLAHRAARVRRHDRRGRRARRAAPFCRPSSPWSAATALHVTAGLLWLLTMMAQVVRQGLPRRHPAPRCSASACSGTRSTSSGSALFTRRLSDGSQRDERPRCTNAPAPGDIAPGDERGRRPRDRDRRARLPDRARRSRRCSPSSRSSSRGTHAGLAAQHPDRAGRAGDRADGRSPGLLPAHHDRARTTPTTSWRWPSAC